ncbi:hypothetical protein E2562_003408 [Oryza meyeriana var. granulata]|uniref:Uncharacterized protein n=1 Tax=Oryza meyeriana var. granulata TaxID=110450 RepID=A0A6G1EEJ9_9ORYZ|nr:hypothetical protein E2562_003408 [Oryza meyeriana var. granulata]
MNSSGNGEVDVQKVEKIAPIAPFHNLVTKPSVYGANRRATTVTTKPAPTADVAAFAGRNNRQPAAASWLNGGAITKEYINKYIEDKKRQFNKETNEQ